MSRDYHGLQVFLAIARAQSFRVAAERLGLSRPAVSQALRTFEDALGTALVRRTTRSVSLTEEGQRLFGAVAPAMGDVDRALDDVGSHESAPRGRLRLCVSTIAERFLSGPLLASFIEACPEVRLDVTITDDEFDIVAAGYDAGVRLGEVVERDMVAVPVSDDQRQLVVGAPSYFARHGTPTHPRQLASHRCIGWRPAPELSPYRWEFAERGREFDVALENHVATNDMGLMIRLAVAGVGLTFGMEETFAGHLARGELRAVLEAFSPTFAGFYLYFPQRTNLSPALRALVAHVRMPAKKRTPVARRKNNLGSRPVRAR